MKNKNSELKFEVGKKYKFSDGRKYAGGCEITGPYGIFVCVNVDMGGGCWTEDATFNGVDGRGFVGTISRGHCVSTLSMLQLGTVIEVNE